MRPVLAIREEDRGLILRLRLHLWGSKTNDRGGYVELAQNWKPVISYYYDTTERLNGCREAFDGLCKLLGAHPEWDFGFGGERRPSNTHVTTGLKLRPPSKGRTRHWQIFVRWDKGEQFEQGNYAEMMNSVELALNGKVVMTIPAMGTERPYGCCRGITHFLSACGEKIEMPMCLTNRHICANYNRED